MSLFRVYRCHIPHNSICCELKNTYLEATYGADFWFQLVWFFDKLRMFFGDMFVPSTVGVESHVAFREHWAFSILLFHVNRLDMGLAGPFVEQLFATNL